MTTDKSLTEQIVTTRRSVLASLGVAAGAGAAVVGDADHDGDSTQSLQSGGIHANLTEQRQRESYVTAPAAQVDTGVLSPGELVVESDTGKRYIWDGSQLVDPGLETKSVRTDNLHTIDRGPSVTVHVENSQSDPTYVASGPNSELARNTNPTPVINTALSHGGHVIVKKSPANYVLETAGVDAEGTPYCIRMQGETTLAIEAGATLEYPAQNTGDDGTDPDVASPILCSGVDRWHIKLNGTIDAGAHASPQSPTDGASYNAMGIKVGVRDQTGTGCKFWAVDGVGHGGGLITGAYRHGVEAIQPRTQFGEFRDLQFDDGSGDDDVSISVDATHVYARRCISNNKSRSGGWSAACFEIEDGASHCACIECHVHNSDHVGFFLGKTHTGYSNATDIWCEDCSVHDSQAGFLLSTVRGTNERLGLIDCQTENITGIAAIVTAGSSGGSPTLKDPYIEGGDFVTSGGANIVVDPSGTIDGLTIDNALVSRPDGDNTDNVRFLGNGTHKNYDISFRRLIGGRAGMRFLGDASNYAGESLVHGNDFRDISFEVVFSSSDIRGYVKTLRNDSNFDFGDYSPVEPANPEQGDEYLDDGTNTSSGTIGKRIYDGSAWVDAWTV